MTIEYVLLHNQDSRFMRPGRENDTYVQGHVGSLEVSGEETLTETLERIFAIHNADDRPDGQKRPSLSVGDVILIGHAAFTVNIAGFRTIGPVGTVLNDYPK